ncbi:MAG: 6-bladed beta-propeller [Opitutaceae bacterium]|nr:6-bladed beta-propeller [Opitutaceae bacterium]
MPRLLLLLLLFCPAAALAAAPAPVRDPAWPGALPEGWKFRMVSNLATDSRGRIYVAHRGAHPVVIFDRDGRCVGSLGDDVFELTLMYDVMKDPPAPISREYWIHGLHVDPADNVWVTDYGRQVVFKFSPEGRLLLTLGTLNRSGADERTFYQPAGVAVARSGRIYVADGYGNSRVVMFSPEGRFLKAWGRKGSGPGEFNLPHALAIDDAGRVYVAERLNHRVQVFDADGNYLTQWPDLPLANAIVLRPEGGAYIGSGRELIQVDADGRRVGKIGDYETLGAPHGLLLDAAGRLYLADPVSDGAARPPRRFTR